MRSRDYLQSLFQRLGIGGGRSGLRSEVQCLVRSNKLEVNSDCRTYESTFWCGFGNEFNARPSYVIEGKAMIRNPFPRLIANWLPCMDSNHDKMIQNHLCYRYTTRQYGERESTLCSSVG